MCLGGGSKAGSSSGSTASVDLTYTPTITIGGNSQEPAKDTTSTFAQTLLAAPPVRIALPEPVTEEPQDDSKKVLLFVAIALVARKVLHG